MATGGPIPAPDDWLQPFLGRLASHGRLLADIGCGPGLDAATLTAAGFSVVAFDRSRHAVARARDQAPAATLVLADLSRPPFRGGSFDAAVSSLALHYLPWSATRGAFAEVRRMLRPGSPFLFRVNATDDLHHGSASGVEVERRLRATPSAHGLDLKRFFDEADVRAAAAGLFVIEQLAHRTIHRYESPKQCWECFARAL